MLVGCGSLEFLQQSRLFFCRTWKNDGTAHVQDSSNSNRARDTRATGPSRVFSAGTRKKKRTFLSGLLVNHRTYIEGQFINLHGARDSQAQVREHLAQTPTFRRFTHKTAACMQSLQIRYGRHFLLARRSRDTKHQSRLSNFKKRCRCRAMVVSTVFSIA